MNLDILEYMVSEGSGMVPRNRVINEKTQNIIRNVKRYEKNLLFVRSDLRSILDAISP